MFEESIEDCIKINQDNEMPIMSNEKSNTDTRKRSFPIDKTFNIEIKLQEEAAKLIKLKAENNAFVSELNQKITMSNSIICQQAKKIKQNNFDIENLRTSLQNEILQRDPVLSKVMNTRSIQTIIEKHSNAITNILNVTHADRQTLSDSYQEAVNVINKVKINSNQSIQQLQFEIEILKKELISEKQRCTELSNHFNSKSNITNDHISLLNHQLLHHEETIKDFKLEKDKFSTEEKKLIGELFSLKSLLNQKEQQIQAMQKDSKIFCDIVNQEKNVLTQEIAEYQNRLAELKINSAKEISDLNDKLQSVEKINEDVKISYENEIIALKSKNEEIKNNETLHVEEKVKLLKEQESLKVEIKMNEINVKKIEHLQQDVHEKSSEIIELLSELKSKKEVLDKYEEELIKTKRSLEVLSEENDQLKNYTRENHQQIDEFKDKLSQTEQKYENAKNEIEQLKRHLEKAPIANQKIYNSAETFASDNENRATKHWNKLVNKEIDNKGEEKFREHHRVKLFTDSEDEFSWHSDSLPFHLIDPNQSSNQDNFFNSNTKEPVKVVKSKRNEIITSNTQNDGADLLNLKKKQNPPKFAKPVISKTKFFKKSQI